VGSSIPASAFFLYKGEVGLRTGTVEPEGDVWEALVSFVFPFPVLLVLFRYSCPLPFEDPPSFTAELLVL
jgi:hypothetical protein